MNPPAPAGEITDEATRAEIHALLPTVVARAPGEAASMLDQYPPDFVAQMLASLNPALAQSVLERFKIERRQKIIAAAPPEIRQQWIRNEGYPENAIGHMMEPALAVFRPATTVAEATRELPGISSRALSLPTSSSWTTQNACAVSWRCGRCFSPVRSNGSTRS